MASPRQKSSATEHTYACEDTSANASSRRPSEHVTHPAAQYRANGHRQEGQHGIVGACFQVQMTNVIQVTEEPGEENIRHISVTKVAECYRTHVSAEKNFAPRYRPFFCQCGG